MGKRGPRPVPKTLRIARGTDKKRPRPNEPEEVSGEMIKPEWLGVFASEKWDELIPILRGRRTYAPAYVDFLAAFCQAYDDMRRADAAITANGDEYLTSEKTGALYLHPAVGIKLNAIDRMAKFGREFGLSPTSIRDIQADKEKAVSGKSGYFGKQA
jgi:P27 family predicted phage terminase small subunit